MTNLGTRVRVLAGVDERVLGDVPSERPRYTALGGVVLGTAVIATLSMFLGLTEVTGSARWQDVVLALVWGAFVCNLDRWLVSSSSAIRWSSKVRVLVPRLLLAFLFGVVIAEPLLLRVFQSAIQQEVRDERQKSLSAYAGLLAACNPVPAVGDPSLGQSPTCQGNHLVVTAGLPSLLSEIISVTNQKRVVQARVDREAGTLRALNEVAMKECNGQTGDGLSGLRGVGPNCDRDRSEADAFQSRSRLDEQNAQLVALSNQISVLSADVGKSTQDYGSARDAAIRQAVATKRHSQMEIGLLERFEALGTLEGTHSFVRRSAWAVRSLFITIDCLPVIVKLLSSATSYEQIVDGELRKGERVALARLQFEERRDTARPEIDAYDEDTKIRSEKDRIDDEYQAGLAQRNVEVAKDVDALTRQILDQPGIWRAKPQES